jgi:UDP-N-acetylglucosamine 2-epimerase
MKNILTILGTRPQYIKLAPIYHLIKSLKDINLIIVDTGQHYDDEMSKFILENLKIENIDYNLGIKEIFHGIQTGKMMILLEPIIQKYKIDHCIVFGDTNSTIAGAIVARKLKIPTSHVEAGIRMHDINMAEELNRRISDGICNYLFAPSKIAFENLLKENQMGETIFSGDIMFDSVKMFQPEMKVNTKIRQIVSKDDNYIFMTLHRAENVDNIENLKEIISNLNITIPIIFPCHPRTKKRIFDNNISIPNNIHILEPISYLELLFHVKESIIVITDSGGLQKESYYLGKRCIVLYPETPWPELESIDAIILASPENIKDKINIWIDKPINLNERPYGNGDASKIIVNKILSTL